MLFVFFKGRKWWVIVRSWWAICVDSQTPQKCEYPLIPLLSNHRHIINILRSGWTFLRQHKIYQTDLPQWINTLSVCGIWPHSVKHLWGAELNPHAIYRFNALFGLAKLFHYCQHCEFLMTGHSLCLTGLQDHLHGFLCTCEGSGVDGEMAQLVLLAKPRSVLNLWQVGEWMERETNRKFFVRDKAAAGWRSV